MPLMYILTKISHAYVKSVFNYCIDIDSWSKYSPGCQLVFTFYVYIIL